MRQAIDMGSAQDWRGEVRRLFDLQAASRWTVSRSSAAERRKKLQRLKAAFEKHRAAVAEGIRRDFGRSAEESEFSRSTPRSTEINYAIAHVGEWMRPEPVEAPLLLADTASEIRWEAKGQVLVLSPWNYPVFLILGPLVGAIAAGNVVIIKPSEKVPETNRALRAAAGGRVRRERGGDDRGRGAGRRGAARASRSTTCSSPAAPGWGSW